MTWLITLDSGALCVDATALRVQVCFMKLNCVIIVETEIVRNFNNYVSLELIRSTRHLSGHL